MFLFLGYSFQGLLFAPDFLKFHKDVLYFNLYWVNSGLLQSGNTCPLNLGTFKKDDFIDDFLSFVFPVLS